MFRKLYTVFAVGVIGFYAITSFMGWELTGSNTRSGFGVPFIGGYRGGK
jgi:hypothetical protein